MKEVANLFVKLGSDISGFTKGFKKSEDQASRWRGTITGTIERVGGGFARLGRIAEFVIGGLIVNSIMKAANAMKNMALSTVQDAISVESAFAGVIKTTDGLVDSAGKLTKMGEEMKKSFRGLAQDIPVAVEDLMQIGELGGQLGIASENLLDFTETIAAVGVSTNLAQEEAATGFARIANVMGTPQARIENMASSVVELGNNFATTERDVLNFATRISGAGAIAGLTEAQVFAIGAAMSSVGVQAEAGGTAVQKVLLGINEAVIGSTGELDIFAKTAGLSAQDFAALWETDAGGAFQAFVEGLGTAGDDALGILDALDLKDQRLIRSFLSLSNAGDLLGRSIETSTTAFAENTALAEEAAKRYATTESQLKLFKNTVRDIGITIGESFLPFLNETLKAARPMAREFGEKLPEALERLQQIAFRAVDAFGGFERIAKFILPSLLGPFAIIFKLFNVWENNIFGVRDAVGQLVPELTGFVNNLRTWFEDLVPKALETFSQIWQQVWPQVVDTITNVIGVVQPIFERVLTWIGESIPKALEFLQGLWGTVWGVIVSVSETLQGIWERIGPAVMESAENIIGGLGAAFAFIQEHGLPIIESLGRVFGAVAEFIVVNVIPVLTEQFEKIGNWWKDNGPLIEELVGAVATFFTESLIPAVEKVWEVVAPIFGDLITLLLDLGTKFLEFALENVVPALTDVVDWLGENLPGAIENARAWVEDTLIPVFEDIGQFVVETLLPKLGELATWFMVTFGQGIDNAILIWENALKPALEGLRQFVQETLLPALGELAAWFMVTFAQGIDNAVLIWENVLKPALEAMWGFIKNTLMPILEEAGAWFADKFGKGMENLSLIWNEVLLPVLGETIIIIAKIIEFIGDAVEAVIGFTEGVVEVAETIGAILSFGEGGGAAGGLGAAGAMAAREEEGFVSGGGPFGISALGGRTDDSSSTTNNEQTQNFGDINIFLPDIIGNLLEMLQTITP